VLLGVLLALARLNRDSEMAALAACGVGPGSIMRPIGLLSLAAAVGIGWLSLVKAPAASRTIEEIRFQAQEGTELGALTPGRFTSTDSGSTVMYAREVEGNHMRGVFILREFADRIAIVIAEEGDRIVGKDGNELRLRLREGRRYEGRPGDADFFVAEFGEQGIPIELEQKNLEAAIESRSTASLWASRDPESRAELEWRIAAPLSILILSILAVPLGRSSPREGKYARVGLGLLLYLIYANSLSIARVWVERDVVPPWLGIWWVHLVLAVLAIAMFAQQAGVGAQRKGNVVRHEPTG
jgi:lipopolysaccharide export system permease protein